MLNIPTEIQLADCTYYKPDKIDILLGAGIFWELLCVGQIKMSKREPVLQKTRLGWVLSGNVITPVSNQGKTKGQAAVCNLSTNMGVQEQLEKFWKIEEVCSSKKMSREEQECEHHFRDTTKHDKDGHFVVQLPVKDGLQELGDSMDNALKRFHALERKLLRNHDVQIQYKQFMDDYEKMGHMSKIAEEKREDSDKPIFYLPHHPVIKESSTTTKLRVVFDASAKTSSGVSLNDRLKNGPIIQDELYAILVRFRKHIYVVGADVEKMYRMIWVTPEQRDLQRIIWRSKPEEPIAHYQLNTLTYGTTSASYMAIRSLHEAAYESQNDYPEA